MIKIKARPLTPDAFAPYGAYANAFERDAGNGDAMAYYPDNVTIDLGGMAAAVGICRTGAQPMVMDSAEYHVGTEEGWLVADGDCAAAFAPAGENPVSEEFEAFFIPRGVAVSLKKGVWHFAPFPIGEERATVFAILPPGTPERDCIVKKLPQPLEIEV